MAPANLSSFAVLLKFLNKVHNTVSETYVNDNEVTNMFLQDPSMKDIFNFFPDRIVIDCKLIIFEKYYYLYTFSCEDSNGRNHIIAVGILQENNTDSVLWMMNSFKKHNPKWRQVKCMCVDSNIKQRELVKECFPQALQIICFFHAYITFKKDVKQFQESHYILLQQIEFAVDLFKSLYFAQNQSEFELRYTLAGTMPRVLGSYLDNIWMPLQQEWRISLDYEHEDIFLSTNCFLQEVADAISAIADLSSDICEFIKKLFLYISLKKKEVLNMLPASNLYSRFSSHYNITKTLTPYASKFVIKQLELSLDISTNTNIVADTYIFNYLGINVSATLIQCTCHFFLFTLLPCRHIFAARKMNSLHNFDTCLVPYAFNVKPYENSILHMNEYLEKGTNCQIPKDSGSRSSLARHLMETSFINFRDLSQQDFSIKMNQLKQVIEAWKKNDDVTVQFVGIEQPTYKSDASNVPSCIPSTSHNIQHMLNPGNFLENMYLPVSTPDIRPLEVLPYDSPSSTANIDSSVISCMTSDISSNNHRYTAGDHLTTSSLLPIQTNSLWEPLKSTMKKEISAPRVSSAYNQENNPHIDSSGSKIMRSSPGCFPSSTTLKKDIVPSSNSMPSSSSTDSACSTAEHGLSQCSTAEHGLSDFNTRLLDGPNVNLAYLCCHICHTKEGIVDFLRKQGLLPNSMKCEVCGSDMINRSVSRIQDGSAWCCSKTEGKKCSKRQSIRAGTWYETENRTLEQLMVFCYLWINKFDNNMLIQTSGISGPNFIKLDKYLSRVCLQTIENHLNEVDTSSRSFRDRWVEQNGGTSGDIFIKFLKAIDAVWKNHSNPDPIGRPGQ